MVVDAETHFKGAVFLDDLCSTDAHRPGSSSVEHLVQDSCPTASPETLLEEVLRLTITTEKPLVVLDEEWCLIGTVSRADGMAALLGDTDGVI